MNPSVVAVRAAAASPGKATFMAIDPGAFRDADDFKADLDVMIDALHAVPPADLSQPVLVAGDPEAAAAADRRANGIPLHPGQIASLRELTVACGAPFLLDKVA